MDFNVDVFIALTTTGQTVITESGCNADEIDFVLLDYPLCSVQLCIPSEAATEDIIYMLKDKLKSSFGSVVVKSEEKFLYIGNYASTLSNGLVTHSSPPEETETDHFFERWDELKSLLIEYSVYSENTTTGERIKYLTGYAGLWAKETWAFLKHIDHPKFLIVEDI